MINGRLTISLEYVDLTDINAVSHLNQRMQELWSLLRQSQSLRRIAIGLHCSYDQAKRLRRKLLATIGTNE